MAIKILPSVFAESAAEIAVIVVSTLAVFDVPRLADVDLPIETIGVDINSALQIETPIRARPVS